MLKLVEQRQQNMHYLETDYDTIATALAASYPGPAENLGSFGSFDVRVFKC